MYNRVRKLVPQLTPLRCRTRLINRSGLERRVEPERGVLASGNSCPCCGQLRRWIAVMGAGTSGTGVVTYTSVRIQPRSLGAERSGRRQTLTSSGRARSAHRACLPERGVRFRCDGASLGVISHSDCQWTAVSSGAVDSREAVAALDQGTVPYITVGVNAGAARTGTITARANDLCKQAAAAAGRQYHCYSASLDSVPTSGCAIRHRDGECLRGGRS